MTSPREELESIGTPEKHKPAHSWVFLSAAWGPAWRRRDTLPLTEDSSLKAHCKSPNMRFFKFTFPEGPRNTHSYSPSAHIKAHVCQHDFSPQPWRPTITPLSRSLRLVAVLTGTPTFTAAGQGGAGPQAAVTGNPACSLSHPPPVTYSPQALTSSFLEQKHSGKTAPHVDVETLCTPLPAPGLHSFLQSYIPASSLLRSSSPPGSVSRSLFPF